MTRYRRLLAGVFVAGAALALAACGGGSAGGGSQPSTSGASATSGSGASSGSKLTTLTMGYLPNAQAAAINLGIQRGTFKKHGLMIKTAQGGSTGAVPLLLKGQDQLAMGSMAAPMKAHAHGLDVPVVWGVAADYQSPHGDQFQVVAAPHSGISSYKDLDGKTVAVDSLGSSWTVSLQEAIRRDGGDPDNVKLLEIKFGDQTAALSQGRVQAIYSFPPFTTEAIAAGGKPLGDPMTTALGAHSTDTVIYASKSYIDQHPDVMKRWYAAMAQAATYANAHPDQVRATIVRTTGASASAVAKLPLPWYSTGVNRATATSEARLMVKYGALKSAPALDDIVSPQAPNATDLKTPPPGLKVSG